METKIQDQFQSFAASLLGYLPNLLGGLILVLLGWLVGWIIKRILVQLMILLRVERYLKRSRFKNDFSKADVRYSFYNFIGNIGFVIIFLIFLDNALLAWKLNVLTDLLNQGILFLPKIIIASIIFGIGWIVSSWAQVSIFKALTKEGVPRSSLISRFSKSILLIFFTAISLVELDLAKEIVIIGFSTIFVTLGLIAVVITFVGGKSFLDKIENTLTQEDSKPD
jgi:hypothetical protein